MNFRQVWCYKIRTFWSSLQLINIGGTFKSTKLSTKILCGCVCEFFDFHIHARDNMRGGGPLHNARDRRAALWACRYAPLCESFGRCAAPRGEARRIARSFGLRADTRPHILKGVYEVNHLAGVHVLSHTHTWAHETSPQELVYMLVHKQAWTWGPTTKIGPLFLCPLSLGSTSFIFNSNSFLFVCKLLGRVTSQFFQQWLQLRATRIPTQIL